MRGARLPRPRVRAPYFTKRESEVVALLCEGHSDESIANQLEIGIYTVKNHIISARAKKFCNSRLELAVTVLKEQFAAEIERLKGRKDHDHGKPHQEARRAAADSL